jgi:hypothetical protein
MPRANPPERQMTDDELLAELEEAKQRMVAINKAWEKTGKPTPVPFAAAVIRETEKRIEHIRKQLKLKEQLHRGLR